MTCVCVIAPLSAYRGTLNTHKNESESEEKRPAQKTTAFDLLVIPWLLKEA